MRKEKAYYCQLCGEKFFNSEECKNHEYSHLPSKMTLEYAIKELEAASNHSCSEKTLIEEGLTSHSEMFGGEYLKDLCVVPASFALNLARKLYKVTKNKDMIIYLDDEEYLIRRGNI